MPREHRKLKLVCLEDTPYPGTFHLADAETGEFITGVTKIKVIDDADGLLVVKATIVLDRHTQVEATNGEQA